MLFVVQESYNAGTNWVDIYHFEAIKTTVVYISPVLSLQGNRLRYIQTISGTTPSFTRSVSRLQNNLDYVYIRQVYDRTLTINTLNARSAIFFIPSTDSINVIVDMGVGGTAPVLQLQGSMGKCKPGDIGSL